MGRGVNRLTARQVVTAKPPKGKDTALLCDGNGLHLQITRNKDGDICRSWTFRYQLAFRRREMGLGSISGGMTLANARAKTLELRALLREQIDPLDEKAKVRQAVIAERVRAVTFQKVVQDYIGLHSPTWSPKHAVQWERSLHHVRALDAIPVGQIDQAMLLRLITPLWNSRTVTASRIINRIEQVLAFATAHGFRAGDNPASNLLAALPKRSKIAPVENLKAVPYSKIGSVMAQLSGTDHIAAKALRFTILTAARTGEIAGMLWSEVDLENRIWAIPGGRMKARRLHRVPLSDSAIELLEGLPRYGDRVFPLGEHALLRALRKVSDTTVHGIRSAFRQWAGEQTSYSRSVVEAALAHKVAADQTENAYLRDADFLERRRPLMQAWSDYCSRPAPSGATLVPFKQVAGA